jgi:TrmH RNA methyltransferase
VALPLLARDNRPIALVLGNEEQGLPRATLKACAAIVSIPGSGLVQSIDVAASDAILLYALSEGPQTLL